MLGVGVRTRRRFTFSLALPPLRRQDPAGICRGGDQALSRRGTMTRHRICSVSVASVYPYYVAKAEKKGRTKAEVDEIICWLTGHDQATLDDELAKNVNFDDFFAHAPRMNPARSSITGVICGVRVEDVEQPTMREIRYLDKLV